MTIGPTDVNLSTYKPAAEFGMNSAPNNLSIASAAIAHKKCARWMMKERARDMVRVATDGWVKIEKSPRQIRVVVVHLSGGS